MKKLGFFLLYLFLPVYMMAQQKGPDVVYLNNGTVIQGTIESDANSSIIKIRNLKGVLYEYKKGEIRRIKKGNVVLPEASSRNRYVDYLDRSAGYWCAAEFSAGSSLQFDRSNLAPLNLSFVNGYQFNEFLKMGMGIGVRYYINNDEIRRSHIAWAFPIFANVRGNIISQESRSIVPYWSFDLGGAVRDGVYVSPTIGARFGIHRSSLLLGLSYVGQQMNLQEKEDAFVNMITVKIGYEF